MTKNQPGFKLFRLAVGLALIPTILVVLMAAQETPRQETAKSQSASLLELLGIEVSPESLDYLQNKTQFQLHTLLTEQRHPKTWNLSEKIKTDTAAGLHLLFSVDEDIVAKLEELASSPEILEQLSSEIKKTILGGHKIYFYGCGATGRLAKQMESTFWRPFWSSLQADKELWPKVEKNLGAGIGEKLIGEMTGGDRALISSLEGFEDLQLIGRLQLKDRGIEKGDLVIAVTEGGETSSVIGTILGALDDWRQQSDYSPAESRKKLYFVYNNPDDKLRPFERSRQVIDEPGITKINLTTGPMAITGSTRMQATTIETYVLGVALQAAVYDLLHDFLNSKELLKAGFNRPYSIPDNLKAFAPVLTRVKQAVPAIAPWTDLESSTYRQRHFSTYFAGKAMITVFIDSTERSPTFRLYPLDTVELPERRCWIQVWTPAANGREAWLSFLGRPFRGLSEGIYRQPFEEQIDDPYLKQAALESLKRAGQNQQDLYDFSFSEYNLEKRGPKPGDLGVVVSLSPEENELLDASSPSSRFVRLFSGSKASVVTVNVTGLEQKQIAETQKKIDSFYQTKNWPAGQKLLPIWLPVDSTNDPLQLKQNMALKMALNAHSTAVMAKLGRVIGNTMTNVSPSNLKLIGRATYLIQSHVNDGLKKPGWIKKYGRREPISYGEANAVLFDSIAYLKDKEKVAGQTAEVALSIIRILESLRQKRGITGEEALVILEQQGLADYLAGID